jgi:sodium-dependent dicarboxylate transporter 2/3/5
MVVLVLMFGFRFLPPIGTITEVGMGCLGVFLGAVYGWITVGMLWPSLMGLIAYGFTGYISVSDAMTTGFGSNNVLVLIMIFGILGMMESAGLTEYISLKIIGSKLGRGRPWVMIFLLMTASFVLVAVTCSWGSALFVWAIFYKIVETNHISKGKYTGFVITSIIVSAILGGQVFPFSVPVVLLTGAYTGVAGEAAAPSFLPYVLWMVVICQVITVVWLMIGKYALKVETPEIDPDSIEKAKKLDSYQIIVMIFLVAFLAGLILASILPGSFFLTSILNSLGVKGLAALVLTVLIMLNFTKGKQFNDYMKSANWELLVVMALITILSSSLTSAETGIMDFVTTALTPILAGHGVIVFLILITLIPLVLTNVLNNLVIGMLFVPIAYSFAVTMGVNSGMLFVVLVLLTSCALATPAGCAVAAMYFGNSEWIKGSQATRYGILFAAIAWVVTLVVGVPFGMLLF